MRTRRFPGVKPFETEDASLFFGRQRDIADLLDLISIEKLIVLFGKSGYGKSSLLNAGIVPNLNKTTRSSARPIIPIVVRFKNYLPAQTPTPLETVQERMRQILPQDSSITAPFDVWWQTRDIPATLWSAFKHCSSGTSSRYLLIFDQFEEFFGYPANDQLRFREQLAELLYTEIPQVVRDEWEQLGEAEKTLLTTDLSVNVLFAIREDRLSWMSSMKDYLPGILHQRYELKGMQVEQAREAIIRPATLPRADRFDSFSFIYTPEALQTFIQALQMEGTNRIEAFLLQICCENIENNVLARQQLEQNEPIEIALADLPRFDKIYEDYYWGKLEDLPIELQLPAEKLIEDELVSLHPITGLPFRLNADGRKLVTAYGHQGVTETLLTRLTAMFLLRAEPNTTGGYNYEISHDTLLEPILRAKRTRQLREERRRRQNAVAVAILTAILLIGALLFAFWAVRQRNEAILQKERADQQFKIFLDEQINRQQLELQELKRKGEVYRRAQEDQLSAENQSYISQMENQLREIIERRRNLNINK